MFRSRTIYQCTVLTTLLVGVAIRIACLDSFPLGLNQDEASIGYEAYALSTGGVDRNGERWPVHLTSWGSGQNALYAYFLIPIIKIFDLSIFSVRLVNALFGCFSLLVFYLLCKRLGGKSLGLIGLLLLSFNPWHVMISRWALESNLLPAMFLFGVFFLFKGQVKSKYNYFAAFFFALCTFAYGTSYFVLPMFFVLLIGMHWKNKRFLHKLVFPASFFLLLALPIILFVVINQFNGQPIHIFSFTIPRLTGPARFHESQLIFGSESIQLAFQRLLSVFRFIYSGATDLQITNTFPGYRNISLICVVLATAGVFASKVKQKTKILKAWLMAGILVGALVPFNVNRINIIFLPILFFAAIGMHLVLRKSKFVFSLLMAIQIAISGSFVYDYFKHYDALTRRDFSYGLVESIQYAYEKFPGKTINVTRQANMPYIYSLFATKFSPQEFFKTRKILNPGAPFQQVQSFGNFVFGFSQIEVEKNSDRIFVFRNTEQILFNPNSYEISTFGEFGVAKVK